MNAAQLERLGEQLQRLRLFKSRERLEALLQEATASELTYAEFLDRLLSEEVSSKTAKNITMRTHLARFPFVKGLESFDFTCPSRKLVLMEFLNDLPFRCEGGDRVV